MKKLFYLFLILINFIPVNASNNDEVQFNLNQYNINQQTINGIVFPRVNHTLYRGMDSKQYDEVKAIRAMLGDQSAGVESKTLTVLKRMLMGIKESKANLWSHSSLAPVKLTDYFRSQIKYILSTKGVLSESEAYFQAINILDNKYLAYKEIKIQLELINSVSSNYIDWNPDGMFSSVFFEIASKFNPYVTLIKEEKQRSVDLNYWNYMNSGRWGQGYQADTGEFFTPIVIKASDIQGMIHSEGEQYSRTPEEAYIKVNFKGKPVVLLFEKNELNGNIPVVYNNKIYLSKRGISEYYSIRDYKTPPVVPNTLLVPNAIGVVINCADWTNCQIDQSIFNTFNFIKTNIQISSEITDQLGNYHFKAVYPE